MRIMRWALLLVMVIFLAFPASVSAGCIYIPFPICSLDKEGTFSAECKVATLTDHSIAPSKHTYTFWSKCSGGQGAEASNFSLTTVGEWNSDGTVVQKTSNRYNPAISGTVKATCKYDPWIYDGPAANNPCTVTDTFFTTPSSGLHGVEQSTSSSMVTDMTKAPFCSSCRWIPEFQRQQFRTEASSILPTPSAPVIELPASGTSIYNALSKIPVRIKHNPAYGLSWTFERYSNTFKGWFSTTAPVPPLLNAKTNAGVTVGDLNVVATKDITKWRFKVASAFPGAAWSDWRIVSFYELKLQQKLPSKLPPKQPH